MPRVSINGRTSGSRKEKSERRTSDAAEALGVYGLILLLGFGSLYVFIVFGDKPYGLQYATLISYSGAIFIWTFFRTKGVNTKNKLSAPYVRRNLPRLLAIHFSYLCAVFILETLALSVRLSMSTWWLTPQGRKGMQPFDFAVMLSGMAIGVSQIVLFRRILERAKEGFWAESIEKTR